MKALAVIVAGGSGTRMGAEVPKQFMELQGRPVIVHTVEAFAQAISGIEIVVVLPKAHLESGADLIAKYLPGLSVFFVEGGDSRFQSVKNGLGQVREPSVVFVHDAVRCLVSGDLIRRCYSMALEKGSAVPVVPVRDSMRMVSEGGHQAADREKMRAVQTPQTFRSDLLLSAFGQPYRDAFTDEATVVEGNGGEVYLIEGEADNIKITYPIDLVVAGQILASRDGQSSTII